MHFVFVSLSGLWIKQCKKWLWQYLISTSFLLLILDWLRIELDAASRKVGFVSNESSGTRKSQTTSDIHSMLVNHLYAFFTFRKTGRVKLQGFTDLLAPIKTDRFTTSVYLEKVRRSSSVSLPCLRSATPQKRFMKYIETEFFLMSH